MPNLTGLSTIINLLFVVFVLFISYKTTIDNTKDEETWIRNEETFEKLMKIIRFSMNADKGEQIRIVLYRYILPMFGFIALDSTLKILSGRSIVSALIFNVLLLGLIGLLFTLMVTMLRDGRLLPVKFHQKYIIDRLSVNEKLDIKIALQHALDERYANVDLNETSRRKFDELNRDFDIDKPWDAETIRQYWDEYGAFVDKDALRDDIALYINDAQWFAETEGDKFKALSDEEKHQRYLATRKTQKRTFIVIAVITILLNIF